MCPLCCCTQASYRQIDAMEAKKSEAFQMFCHHVQKLTVLSHRNHTLMEVTLGFRDVRGLKYTNRSQRQTLRTPLAGLNPSVSMSQAKLLLFFMHVEFEMISLEMK